VVLVEVHRQTALLAQVVVERQLQPQVVTVVLEPMVLVEVAVQVVVQPVMSVVLVAMVLSLFPTQPTVLMVCLTVQQAAP
jgi:hypothetical protein